MTLKELNEEFFREHEIRAERGDKLIGKNGPGSFIKRASAEDSITVAQSWIWDNAAEKKPKQGFRELRDQWRKTKDDACKEATLEFLYICFAERFGGDFPDAFDPQTVQVAKDQLAKW